MRKLINDPADLVTDALNGLASAHPDLLRVDLGARIVVRADAPADGKVALVSGGGSGHEPLHAGFVGLGMLDAAVPGEVFTSPTPDQVAAAGRAAHAGAGVLQIVKNYTGDRLNFRMAAEDLADEGIDVETVDVRDDISIEERADRRGVAGTLFVEKIAGAAAERGDDLAAVKAVAGRVADAVRSFGVALAPCTPPGVGTPLFDLPPGEMEIGIGIHGEAGRRRGPIAPAGEVAATLAGALLDELEPAARTRVLTLVNGMGATPLIELYALAAGVHDELGRRGLEHAPSLVGNYVTSLDMIGASVTVLALDDELDELWRAPVRTPALRWGA